MTFSTRANGSPTDENVRTERLPHAPYEKIHTNNRRREFRVVRIVVVPARHSLVEEVKRGNVWTNRSMRMRQLLRGKFC